MEIVQDQAGKFTFFLGGVLLDNCTRDSDCPGRSICSINNTILSKPNMCVCELSIDLTGAQCESIGSFGAFFFVSNVISCTYCVSWLLVALYDLYLMIKWKELKRDALGTSLILTILALFWTMLETGAASRFYYQTIPPDPVTGSKTDPSKIGPVTLAFSFLFSTLAMLNVSLVWLEIADNADKLRKSSSNNISRYRNFLIGYYVVFFGFIAISLIAGNLVVAALGALPGIMIVIVTYAIGYFRMKKLLLQYLTSSGNSDSADVLASSKEGVRKIRDSLKAIRRAALGISITASWFIFWLGIWVILGGFDNTPGKGFNLVALGFVWIFASMANGVVMLYLNGAIRRKREITRASIPKNVENTLQSFSKEPTFKSPSETDAKTMQSFFSSAATQTPSFRSKLSSFKSSKKKFSFTSDNPIASMEKLNVPRRLSDSEI